MSTGMIAMSLGVGVCALLLGFVEMVRSSTDHSGSGGHMTRAFMFIGVSIAALSMPKWMQYVGYVASMILGAGSEPPVPESTATGPDVAQLAMYAGLGVGAVALIAATILASRRLLARRRKAQAKAAILTERLGTMRATIDRIAQRIGEIQSDPVASLELYGLFDTAVDASATFWAKWIEVSDKVGAAERMHEIPDGLRGELDATERAWKAAYADAERTGLDAVGPERADEARRAVKAVKLARSTSHEAEAAMAWQRAADILATLHLAHLPASAGRAVEAAARTAIETGR